MSQSVPDDCFEYSNKQYVDSHQFTPFEQKRLISISQRSNVDYIIQRPNIVLIDNVFGVIPLSVAYLIVLLLKFDFDYDFDYEFLARE